CSAGTCDRCRDDACSDCRHHRDEHPRVSATVVFPPGVVPDSGITYLLPRLIGAARARSALLLAERIDAPTSLEWGLAYRVYAPDAFTEGLQSIASRLAAGPTRALGFARQLCSHDLTDFKAPCREGAERTKFGMAPPRISRRNCGVPCKPGSKIPRALE